MDSLQQKEVKFDHQLRDGKCVDSSIALQNEFTNHPREALAILQHAMHKEQHGAHRDKSTVGVEANGDVFVYDSAHTGYYAGTVPAEARARFGITPPAPEGHPTSLAPPPPDANLRAQDYGRQNYVAPPNYEYQGSPQPEYQVPFPIDIGVENGSLHVGLNILGLAKGGISLGAQNRGYVGSDIARTEFSAGVDLNQNHIGPAADWQVLDGVATSGSARVGITPHRDGISLGGGVDANALAGSVGTGGYAGADLGRHVGPRADGYGYVGPAGASAGGYANLSDRGVSAGADADVSAEPLAGVHARGRVGLGRRNEANVNVGTNLGDDGVAAGAGLYPQLRPDAYVAAQAGPESGAIRLNPPRRVVASNNPEPPELGGLY